MAYQYPVRSLPLQVDLASSCFEQSDVTWTNSFNAMQDPGPNFDFWGEVLWEQVEQVEAELQSPSSATGGDQSPTTRSDSSTASYDVSYATSYASQSSVRPLAPRNRRQSSEDDITQDWDDETKVKRRRMQNRNSQRAYRDRARQKEERMSAVIMKLQGEIDELQMREKGSTGMIEALTEEIEMLKRRGLVLHYQPS